MDLQARFKEIIDFELNIKNEKKSIGVISEKTLHRIIKDLYCPCKENQEIKIGNYFVDAIIDNTIIEVQTKQFNRLRTKLEYLLSLDKYKINIIYPVFSFKIIYWINPETGEISGGNKSPKQFKIPEVFYELYKIKPYLNKVNITLLLFDIKEYRNLNGYSKDKKRGSSCYDRIPFNLSQVITLNNSVDYKALLPSTLNKPFTSQELSVKMKTKIRYVNLMLNILCSLNVIKIVGKDGRKYLYTFE